MLDKEKSQNLSGKQDVNPFGHPTPAMQKMYDNPDGPVWTEEEWTKARELYRKYSRRYQGES